MSLSDFEKRSEILLEFVHFIFDSLVIPLVRSNFYVTDSSFHKYKLFYFRHDVWRRFSEPSLVTLKLSNFDELRKNKALAALGDRQLGFSYLRLLPKDNGFRPVMNLKRTTQWSRNGIKVQRRSINSLLTPAFAVLNLEKVCTIKPIASPLLTTGTDAATGEAWFISVLCWGHLYEDSRS